MTHPYDIQVKGRTSAWRGGGHMEKVAYYPATQTCAYGHGYDHDAKHYDMPPTGNATYFYKIMSDAHKYYGLTLKIEVQVKLTLTKYYLQVNAPDSSTTKNKKDTRRRLSKKPAYIQEYTITIKTTYVLIIAIPNVSIHYYFSD